MSSRLFSRKLLGVILLLFFLSFVSCGLPLNPVYVENAEIEIKRFDEYTPLTIFLSFDDLTIYEKNGFNVYYVITNSDENIQSYNKSNLKLCYNLTDNYSDVPLIDITNTINQEDSENVFKFEFEYSTDDGYLYFEEIKLSRLNNGNEPFLSTCMESDDSDIQNSLDDENIYIHLYIQYFASRDPANTSETEIEFLQTYKIIKK